MKHLASILFILLLLTSARATDLVLTNQHVIAHWYSDSCSGSDQNTTYGISTGDGAVDYVFSWLVLNNPTNDVALNNLYHSGGSNIEMLTNRLEAQGLPLWGFQFINCQNIGFCLQGDGGSPSSNSILNTASNIFQASALWHNGFAMTNEGGWSTNHAIQWVGVGGFPELGADGDFAGQGARNNAMVNAGNLYAWKGVDSYNSMSNVFALDYAGGQNRVGFFLTDATGHLGMCGQLLWAFTIIKQLTSDFVVSSAAIDFSAGTVSSTNHCAISDVVKSGNSISFTRLDYRLPMAWDNRPLEGPIVDASSVFALTPTNADFCQFMLQVSNLPAGLYAVKLNGTLCTNLTAVQLAAGWNMFASTIGPYWDKRMNVLNLIRDYQGANRVTHVASGQGPLAASYGSNAGSKWAAGLRGDALITSTITNQIASLNTLKDLIHAEAQPEPVAFTIEPVPVKAPFQVARGMTLHLVFMEGIYTPISDDWTNYWTPVVFASPDLDGLSRQCLTVPRTWELANGHLAIAVTSEEPNQFYRVMFQPN